MAEEPDTIPESPHPLVAALIEALPRQSRVLVVGVGSGRHIPRLLAAGLQVDALEDDPARAADVATRFGAESRVRVMRGSYDKPPAEFSGYDGAVSTHALLHGSPSTIAAALVAIGARLKPGGIFHLTLGSTQDPRYGAGLRIDDATWTPEMGAEAGVPHAYFDKTAARELLSGWNVVALEQCSAAQTAGRWAHFARETATMIHWFVRVERPRNAAQIEYWNSEAGSRWAALQERIDAAFGPLTEATLDHARPQPDETVLDVGCGCGTTALEIARRIGPSGVVLGVDVSRPMLEVAAERARAHHATNLQLVLADAANHQFGEGAYDLAFSRFGVMFFDEPAAAFSNIRRSLRPGGRLAFVCWRELSANPWFLVPMTAAQAHLPPQERPDPEAPGPLAFANPERVRHILTTAGFADVELKRHDTRMKLAGPNQLESAADFTMQIGPVARAIADAGAPTRLAVRNAILEALREHETVEGVHLGAGVWFVSGRA